MTTDTELVERVKGGDVEAFAILGKRYERSVMAVIHAEIREPLMAEDVAVATLRRAFRQLMSSSEKSEFGPWLLRIARRQTIHALRTMPIPVGTADGKSQSNRPFESADSDWIENEHLLGLLARLSEHEQQLIGLRFFDRHSPTDIASMIDRPTVDVSRQLARAINRLRYRWEWEQEL